MNSKFKKALIKSIFSLSLIFMMILTSVVPVWAEEVPSSNIVIGQ